MHASSIQLISVIGFKNYLDIKVQIEKRLQDNDKIEKSLYHCMDIVTVYYKRKQNLFESIANIKQILHCDVYRPRERFYKDELLMLENELLEMSELNISTMDFDLE